MAEGREVANLGYKLSVSGPVNKPGTFYSGEVWHYMHYYFDYLQDTYLIDTALNIMSPTGSRPGPALH